MPDLNAFISEAALMGLIAVAREEDLGQLEGGGAGGGVGGGGLDVTTMAFVDRAAVLEMRVVARQAGVLSGLALGSRVVAAYGEELELEESRSDGDRLAAGDAVATLRGPAWGVLMVERVLLNLLTHLSGIATLTASYVEQVKGTRAEVCCTRKTHWGLRGLEKYAVACGGGTTHRMGLYDAVLVKDNHLAGVPMGGLVARLEEAVVEARRLNPQLQSVQVEVDTLEQLAVVLEAPIDLVLLDNMPAEVLREAVAMRDRVAPAVRLEASGGVTLETVAGLAASGVDRVSVGALTHSAPALDLGLDWGQG
ncbi:MAG: carboxylating nicotinate-nucleotide diphosphorylase [Planctomycetota bacterium]